ncbi:MAG TPA: LpqB family beta-propeller domain-containing protein [Microlunatus sp.]
MNALSDRPIRALLIIGVLLGSLVLAGCVSVPTSGRVEQANQGSRISDTKPEAVPKPPVQNASPRVIVDGFLFAMSRYQANYQIARQFLTEDARDSWRPEDRITVYTNPKYDTTGSNVTLSFTRVGQVGPDGSYTATTGPQVQDFEMQKDGNGQWRISNPPDGLLISDSTFSATYASYNLYFFDSQFRTLVPDPIYLPTDGQTETALVQALLRGPTSWLKSAVSTEFPPRTTLVGDSVPIANDLAQISLGPSVAGLNDQQKTRMAAQLAWTLDQTDSELRGFQIAVNGDRLQVPGQVGEGESAYVPISYGSDFAPIPDDTSDSLIGIHDGAVIKVGNDGSSLAPLPGPLGRKGYDPDSVALSNDGRTVAAVTDDRTQLITQLSDQEPKTAQLTDPKRLLRPDYTRDDELWTVSGKPGKQIIRIVKNDRQYTVTAPWLGRIAVTNFRISPDGSRMALIGKSGGKDLLAVAPIIRGDKTTTVGTVRFISMMDTASAQVKLIADLGWISPTRLLILGASNSGASYEPYGVEIDGSQFERVGTSDNWGAKSLATRAESGGSFQAVVSGRSSKAWMYRSGDEWGLLSNDLRSPAYAG